MMLGGYLSRINRGLRTTSYPKVSSIFIKDSKISLVLIFLLYFILEVNEFKFFKDLEDIFPKCTI